MVGVRLDFLPIASGWPAPARLSMGGSADYFDGEFQAKKQRRRPNGRLLNYGEISRDCRGKISLKQKFISIILFLFIVHMNFIQDQQGDCCARTSAGINQL